MPELSEAHPLVIERSCALTAVALSDQRREGARLMTGEHRSFGLNTTLTVVHVPYPTPRGWTRRTLTCGVALQCSPSKDRLARYRLSDLSSREHRALTLVEASVALGWVAARWPGLLSEMRRVLPDLDDADRNTQATAMLDRTIELARTRQPYRPLAQGAEALDPTALCHLPMAYLSPGREAEVIGAEAGIELPTARRLVQCAIAIRTADDVFHFEPPSTRALVTAAQLIASGATEMEAAEACILAPLTTDGAIHDGLREIAAASLLTTY